MSFSQVEENKRAICLPKLAASSAECVTLPECIHLYVFTTVAYDNIDFIEETLTGEVTSHQVNEIIIQPLVYGHIQKSLYSSMQKKQKQRRILTAEIGLPVHNTGQKIEPGFVRTVVIQNCDAVQ